MDVNKLVEVLKATLDPNRREEAEAQLNEVHKIIGFAPVLLQVVMSVELEMPVKQAGVIYLKNMVSQFWQEREAENVTDPVPFSLHEQDKVQIRENIVEGVIQAPDPVRVQLAVCISNMIKHDYPSKWPGIAEKVAMYIQSDNHNTWLGALMCLYQLVKNFEYKKPEERGALNQAMQVLLPLTHQRCLQLLNDPSDMSVLIQKQILKIFYALIQYFLPMDLITKDVFTQWMLLVKQIVDRPVPEATNQIDEEDRPELPWWKCKKWALHILARSFERYGSPGNVLKDYNQFSEWYLKTFSEGIISSLLNLLDQYRKKIYVAPRVLQQTLNYLNQGVSHAVSWKHLKVHMPGITQEVLFPLMCHSDEDEELWHTDPHEYIRMKYDVFEEFFSPTLAAQGLLHSAVSKRKQVLQKTMQFVVGVMATPNVGPRQKDGALHMIGSIADVILKRQLYKDQAENMIVTHVFPEFQSQHGFLRAKACWMLHQFCEVKYRNEQSVVQALGLTKNCLCTDRDLPVRVEAAMALQGLLSEQTSAKELIQPYVREVILELLKIIRETENDDLTQVVQKIVCMYVEEVTPIAVEMTSHLAQTFAQVLESNEEDSDQKAITAMGILSTLETIVTVMEDQKTIMGQIEEIILSVVGIIIQQNVIEFYEELLSLVYSLTCQHISPHMWRVFNMIYEMFQKDGFDYFTDMMPALHNYITVDTETFSSDPRYLEMIYTMCKSILTGDPGEDAECHAAKLLEVCLLQYKGRIDQVVGSFVELALERLTRMIRTSELRTMCLQVVVSGLYYNPPLLLDILEKIHLPNTSVPITARFLEEWLRDTDCFLGLHDRKVCVLGLLALIDTPANRPAAINGVANQIIPSLLVLFAGLKRAYASRAEGGDTDDEDEEGEEYEEGELASDEDEIDEDGQQYLEKLEKSTVVGADDDDDDDYDEEAEETALESYQTPLDQEECPIDEYQVFRSVLQNVQNADPAWYNALFASLTKEQQEELTEVFTYAEQRKAAADSKRIEQQGGYIFNQTSVPSTFNFGGAQG